LSSPLPKEERVRFLCVSFFTCTGCSAAAQLAAELAEQLATLLACYAQLAVSGSISQHRQLRGFRRVSHELYRADEPAQRQLLVKGRDRAGIIRVCLRIALTNQTVPRTGRSELTRRLAAVRA
jgi:hypothetical protein